MKVPSLAIQKVWPMLKFLQTNGQTDRQKTICPWIEDSGGIKIPNKLTIHVHLRAKLKVTKHFFTIYFIEICFILTSSYVLIPGQIQIKLYNQNQKVCGFFPLIFKFFVHLKINFWWIIIMFNSCKGYIEKRSFKILPFVFHIAYFCKGWMIFFFSNYGNGPHLILHLVVNFHSHRNKYDLGRLINENYSEKLFCDFWHVSVHVLQN